MKLLTAILFAMAASFLHADDNTYGGSYMPPQPGGFYFNKPGKYQGHFREKNDSVIDVSIKVISYQERFPKGPKVHVRWGTDGDVPKALIGQFDITVNGIAAPLDLADFDYLGNPVCLNVWMEKGDCVVELQGGDAAGSYNCFWYFHFFKDRSAYLLLKRFIQAGELPDECQETTTYKYNRWN